MANNYGIKFPPIHQYKISGANTVIPSGSSLEVTESNVYMVNASNTNRIVQISDSDITSDPTEATGISIASRRWFYIYIESGQYVRADGDNCTLTPLRAV